MLWTASISAAPCAARFAAATGVDLCLDHHRCRVLRGDGLIDRECHLTGAHHPILGEELLADTRTTTGVASRIAYGEILGSELRSPPLAPGETSCPSPRSADECSLGDPRRHHRRDDRRRPRWRRAVPQPERRRRLQLGDTDFDADQIGRISEEIDDRGRSSTATSPDAAATSSFSISATIPRVGSPSMPARSAPRATVSSSGTTMPNVSISFWPTGTTPSVRMSRWTSEATSRPAN